MAFWKVGQGHAFIMKEEQEYLRNSWGGELILILSSASLGTWVKATNRHTWHLQWLRVSSLQASPDWIERFLGILWGFSLAEFWRDSRAAQEPHPSGMFCLAGPPTWVALSPGWVARATQPGCVDGQSLQVSKALVPDIFGHWFNFCFQKYPWSKQWAVHKRSCVFFSPSFYINYV